MRQDQYERLQELGTKIADVALFDADPENWIGANVPAKDLTKEQRGDAYWCRKLAVSSLSVLMRVQSVIGHLELSGAGSKPPEEVESDGLEADIRDAEQQATQLLDSLTKRPAQQAKFVERATGK